MGMGKGCPFSGHLQSQEVASARTGTRLQVFTAGHSSASSSSPKWTLGGTFRVSLNFKLGTGIYERVEKGPAFRFCLKGLCELHLSVYDMDIKCFAATGKSNQRSS